MSITSMGLSGLEKATIPTTSRFPSPTLPPLNTRFPPLDARLVAAARLPGFSMYGSPYTSPNFPGYLPYTPAAAAIAAAASDPSAFYTPMGHGDNIETWRASLGQAAAAAYYDPTLAAHYGYGYGPMGLSDGARRKNATRETTSTLKSWLNEHRKNPYPTKGEKIMLAIITKMSLTQVSTWFANARRRLKKENKMTWSPRNRCGEDDDDDDLMNDGPHHGEATNSRLPSPMSPEAPSNGHSSSHSVERQCNGQSSGIDSYSDEGAHFGDTKRENSHFKPTKIKTSLSEKNEEEPASNVDMNQGSFDDFKSKLPLSLRSRQQSHPFESARTSPSLANISSNTSMTRPNIPFPHPLSQLPLPHPHSNILYPGLSENLNHSSAFNRLPPHIMAAFFEQAQQQYHYQQALHGIPVGSILANSNSENFKLSPTVTTSVTEPIVSQTISGGTSSVSLSASKSTTVSSPNKCKIWSIADVATNKDTGKSALNSTLNDERMISPTIKSTPNDVQNTQMLMDLLQQRISASMTNNPTHLPPGLHSSSGMISQGRFPSFHSFPGLLSTPENSKVSLKELERNSQDIPERTSFSPLSHSSEAKDTHTSENLSNGLSRSPRNSYHGDSSHDINDGK